MPTILAIDTSCDDTAAAVVDGITILSNVIASQTELHKPYGGVFPTVAKQAHKENIFPTVEVAMQRAQKKWSDIDYIAVTQGPGLAPALEVGIRAAKKLAKKHGKQIIPTNHIEGHMLSPLAVAKRKSEDKATTKYGQHTVLSLPPNTLCITISGGHSQFTKINKDGTYTILGKTIDDAAGECLDKVGRMLNLGYPAGAVIEKMAKQGDEKAYDFPLPMTHIKTYDLSFSGLKTHARNLLEELERGKPLNKTQICDFAASIQYSVFRHICYKMNKIMKDEKVSQIWLGGGVAANTKLRQMIRATIKPYKGNLVNPKLAVPYTKKLCQDNAAMIGLAAGFHVGEAVGESEFDRIERVPKLTL